MTNFTLFAEAYFAAPVTDARAPSRDGLARALASLSAKLSAAAKQSPYAVLGVSPKADLQTVRVAYMEKVAALHPDRYRAAGVNADLLALLSSQLAEVNAAYRAVKLRAKKFAYLRSISFAKTQRSAKAAA